MATWQAFASTKLSSVESQNPVAAGRHQRYVFYRQIVVGKRVWLYAFVLHWICLYLASDPLLRAVADWR